MTEDEKERLENRISNLERALLGYHALTKFSLRASEFDSVENMFIAFFDSMKANNSSAAQTTGCDFLSNIGPHQWGYWG